MAARRASGAGFRKRPSIVTGDHRKMLPVTRRRRQIWRARRRAPPVIIGKGAAQGAVDDRLFQQADLLRMLDRALQPGRFCLRSSCGSNATCLYLA